MTTATGPSAPSGPAGHVRWRRHLIKVLGACLILVVLWHVLGAGTLEMAGIGLGAVALLVVVVWKLPQMWKHTHPAGRDTWKRRSRTGSLNYPGQAGRGLPSIRGKGRGGSLGTMGRRHRPGSAPFRRSGGAGLRTGSRGRGSMTGARRRAGLTGAAAGRRSGLPGSRSRSGRLAGTSRRPGSGIPGSRSRSGRSRGALGGSRGRTLSFRRGSGASGRSRGAFGRSGRGSGASGRSRGGSGASRRSSFRPFRGAAGRRTGAGGRRGTGSFRRPPVGSRRGGRLIPRGRGAAAGGRRPPAGSRRGGRLVPAGGARGRAGTAPVRRRRWFSPFRRRSPYGTAARATGGGWSPARITRNVRGRGRIRPGVAMRPRMPLRRRIRRGRLRLRYARRRMGGAFRRSPFRLPVPVRYAMWRLRGRPGAAGTWGTRLRARRAMLRARTARLRANPQIARHRPWYAPWRLHAGGRRRSFRRWRRNRRLVVPRNAQGVPLGRRARMRRRWRIWRGRPGTGTILFRPRQRRQLVRGRLRTGLYWLGLVSTRGSSRNWRRRSRPPGSWTDRLWPGFGWLGGLTARLDRRRMRRWMANRPPATPQQPPRTRRPNVSWTDSRARNSGAVYQRFTGGRTVDTHAMAQEIEGMAGRDFADPQDVHDTVSGMHELVAAMETTLRQMGEKLRETGVHQSYPEAVTEAANAMSGIAQQLQQVTAGGVMRGPGGG